MRDKLLQSAGCLASALVSSKFDYLLSGEFSGGQITSHLADAYDTGFLLFALAFIVTFIKLRVGSMIALLACILYLPLYFYCLAPGIFRKIFHGEYSVPLTSTLVWDRWSFIGVLLIAIVAYLSLRSFKLQK